MPDAEDLELAGRILESQTPKPKPGQLWRDKNIGDILKVLEIDANDGPDPQPVLYVRCACYPRGEYFLGIQEMKASRLGGDERFELMKLNWFTRRWYQWKFRKP